VVSLASPREDERRRVVHHARRAPGRERSPSEAFGRASRQRPSRQSSWNHRTKSPTMAPVKSQLAFASKFVKGKRVSPRFTHILTFNLMVYAFRCM